MYMHRICIVGHIPRLLGLVSDDSSRAAAGNSDGSMLQQLVFELYIMMQQSVVKHGMYCLIERVAGCLNWSAGAFHHDLIVMLVWSSMSARKYCVMVISLCSSQK